MMQAKTEQRVKRWNDQRWVIDSVIQAIGMEWDQPRLRYTLYPCGPDAIADFQSVSQRVKKFADMHREFAAAAGRREAKASRFEEENRPVAARESYFIASLLWSSARWPIFETNAHAIEYNVRMNACYEKFIRYAPRPIERIEIPFGDAGKSLPGYLHLPHKPAPGEKFPCVLSVDGMDASKEIMCSMYGDKFLERGIANFIYDGPGQGECLIDEIFVTDTNHMDAAVAIYETLSRHPHIDKDRLVVFGISYGSFFGLQAAVALGARIQGVAVTFICHEPGMNALMNMSSPSFKMRFMYMAGYEDEAAFDQFAKKFTLMPYIDKIECPVLIQAGEDDELSPIQFTEDLVAKIKTKKLFVTYEAERHSIGGYSASQLGENWFTMLADWCSDRLCGKQAPNARVFIDATGQMRSDGLR